MAIKLTKNELKKQKDNLKQFQRYLPTLQLKKQQLQSVIMKIRQELEQREAERVQMIGDLDDWVAVFAENEIFLLDAPIVRIAAKDTPVPFSPDLENYVIPSKEDIIEAARKLAKY